MPSRMILERYLNVPTDAVNATQPNAIDDK